MITLYRRRKLGYKSCREAIKYLKELFNIDGLVVRNDKGVANTPLVMRWGCTSNVGQSTTSVVNSAKMIHDVADKIGCRKLLQDAGVSVPKTFFSKND